MHDNLDNIVEAALTEIAEPGVIIKSSEWVCDACLKNDSICHGVLRAFEILPKIFQLMNLLHGENSILSHLRALTVYS